MTRSPLINISVIEISAEQFFRLQSKVLESEEEP